MAPEKSGPHFMCLFFPGKSRFLIEVTGIVLCKAHKWGWGRSRYMELRASCGASRGAAEGSYNFFQEVSRNVWEWWWILGGKYGIFGGQLDEWRLG